jgi:phage terminase large subunit-like protein
MEWTTSCVDWERRIVAREPLIVSPPLFPQEADEAWDICGGFRLVDVTGQPLLRDAALPWLRDFVRAVFGAYNPEDGRRYINEFLFCVSKKNGKSSIAAAIMLCALIMNWRQSAELLILSPTKEIADNSYKPIRDMIRADDELNSDKGGLLKVQDYWRTITHTGTGATLKVVAADSDTVSGKKASFVFVDELHEFGKQAKASNMLLEATGGLASRPEGFVIYATTQSAEPPAGVFKEKLTYARKVRDGTIKDSRFLPVIYEFPDSMLAAGAHKDLANAYVTNPNWGASVDIARITQLHSQALESGENSFKEFLAKHLNVEIGMNLRGDRWAGADYWEACADASLTLDELLARSEVVVVGIDGGGLDDLLGLALLGRCRETRRWLAWCKAWAHKIALERRKEIAARLLDFERAGDLTIVDMPGQDVQEVADLICRVRDAGLLPEKNSIGVDASGIGDIVDELTAPGRDFVIGQIVAIKQGWSMNGAVKTLERKCAGHELAHGGSDLMNWCVGNARIVPAGNAITITKQASGTAKIDPLMALIDAATLMAMNPQAYGGSVYEDIARQRKQHQGTPA